MKKALFLVFVLSCGFFSSYSLVYDEITGENASKTTYHLSESDGKHLITSDSPKETFSMVYSSSYQLEKISFASKENKQHYDMTLNGSTLTFIGDVNGQEKTKTFSLSNKPWIQNFVFGLMPFAGSSQNSIQFYVVSTKDLSFYQMRAKKMEVSTITVNDKSYKVQKIEVRLTGFKSLFWKAELWFDIETHQMILYQTNEGPNAPLTTMKFVEKHSSF